MFNVFSMLNSCKMIDFWDNLYGTMHEKFEYLAKTNFDSRQAYFESDFPKFEKEFNFIRNVVKFFIFSFYGS